MPGILVTAKVNPDLDGTACSLAYADLLNKLGGEAEGLMFGSPQIETQYFTEKYGIKIPSHDNDGKGDWVNFVLVDSSSMKGMPKVVKREAVIETIDHREGSPEEEFPSAQIQNELIGAAATIVIERFQKANLLPKDDHAKLLYGAIYHNTLNFLATNTDERDRAAAAFLETSFNLKSDLALGMFTYMTARILSNLRAAITSDAKEFELFPRQNFVGAHQIVIYGGKIESYESEVSQVVDDLEKEFNCGWSFVNVVDLERKKSLIFASNDKAIRALEGALAAKFKGKWAILDPVLRKQIIPKLSALIVSTK